MTPPRAREAAGDCETRPAPSVAFRRGVALSAPAELPPSGEAARVPALVADRDRSVRSATPARVAEGYALRGGAPAVPSSTLSPSRLSSPVERSPRGAEESRLSEEDVDKDSE